MRIFSWNVNGLYTTLKDAAYRHSSVSNYFSNILNAEIICFQEAKIQEEKLEKWLACVPGYESFWAFSKGKKGYSGVVTYVKEELLPLDAKANWMGDFDDPLLEDFCNEGRIVETDHGSFILINVYAPNAGENEQGRPRLSFKLSFLKALKQKLDELVQIGRNIVVVGDLNVAHKDKDVYRKWNIRDIYTAEEINFMDALLTEYVDLFRYFHPNEEDAFSVWDQKKEARIHNEGLRIDYALCDQGFLSQVASTDIIKMVPKVWSDHAAVVTTLIEQPVLPPHPKPAISSSNMRKFIEETKQKRLTSLFSQSPLKSAKHRETMNEKDGQEPSDTATKESEGEFMTSKKRQQVDESENPFQAPVSKAKKHTSSSTIAGPALVKDRQRSLLSYLQKG